MFRYLRRGLMSRKLRLLLTAVSISLGVAFVAGTSILVDTTQYAVGDFMRKTEARIDVVVRGAVSKDVQAFGEAKPIATGVVGEVRAVPGVAAAAGDVQGYAQIIDKQGKALTTTGAPTLGVSGDDSSDLGAATLRQGHWPHGSTEVAIDAATARRADYHPGDTVSVLFQDSRRDFTLVGTFGFADLDSMIGATVAAFDLPTAQEVLGKGDTLDAVFVRAAPGVSAEDLRDRISTSLGSAYDVVTSAQDADRTAQSVESQMGIFSSALFIFAAISLFVGAFIIFNTFSILLAQRVRELGLLRALGASTTQIVGVVLAEAVVVGVLASAVGLALGAAVAAGLYAALGAAGMELPSTSLQWQVHTVVTAFAVGVGVTLVAALLPALHTRRVAPLTALQAGLTNEDARMPLRRILGGVLVAVVGAAGLAWGMFGGLADPTLAIAAGSALCLLGTAMLSPLIARPCAAAIGWPVARLLGVSARLGRRNAMRSPSRTARTAAALMIGLGMVTAVGVIGASIKATTLASLDHLVRADYVIQPPTTFGSGGFSPAVAADVRAIPGVAAVAEVRSGFWVHNGKPEIVNGGDAATLADFYDVTVVSGSLYDSSVNSVAITDAVARREGLRVGDVITVTFPTGGVRHLTVSSVFKPNGINIEYVIPMAVYAQNFSQQLDNSVSVRLSAAADPAAVKQALDAVMTRYPSAQLFDSAAYKADQVQRVDQLLGLIYTLLALAVVIALLGIVNTLALAVVERQRELGLLRAVGMSRRGVRAMVRWEAVIIAVFGSLLGLVVGCAFGWFAVQSMTGAQLEPRFALPVSLLVEFLVIAIAGAVIAAVVPARHAARVDILRSVATT